MKYAKIALLVAACTALMTVLSPVAALAEFDAPYVAFGADLTEDQQYELLQVLEVEPDAVNEDTSVYVTNDEEHRYLDDIFGSERVGSEAVSACKIVKRERGYGIRVVTNNISHVTDRMYQNALATCGMQDADVVVASPTPISGTTALVGAMSAYSKMSGQALYLSVILGAAEELDLAGLIGDLVGDSDKVSQLIAAVKAVVLTNKLETEEDIRNAVTDIASQMELSLSEENIDRIVSAIMSITSLNLDADKVSEQIRNIYEDALENGLDLSQYGITEDTAESILDKVPQLLGRLFGSDEV